MQLFSNINGNFHILSEFLLIHVLCIFTQLLTLIYHTEPNYRITGILICLIPPYVIHVISGLVQKGLFNFY